MRVHYGKIVSSNCDKGGILNKSICVILIVFTFSILFAENGEEDFLPVSAPITTTSAGINGQIASKSVFRVNNNLENKSGTGFLHKSGNVITAAHVVENCSSADVLLLLSDGKVMGISEIILDSDFDLALLKPLERINAKSLKILDTNELEVGLQVVSWGFPSGYSSLIPLLTVGYLAGIDRVFVSDSISVNKWVVNAAFNSGNSGGPVLNIDNGEIIGVVSSKLAPIPNVTLNALTALSNQTAGFMYTRTYPDGSTEKISEGKIISEILHYLRGQTQLVLGHAVTSKNLILFLKNNNIDP